MSRICPLMFTSTADIESFECKPNHCAWALDGGCAVRVIADALSHLAAEGISVWYEGED